jgi:hypothetical protein
MTTYNDIHDDISSLLQNIKGGNTVPNSQKYAKARDQVPAKPSFNDIAESIPLDDPYSDFEPNSHDFELAPMPAVGEVPFHLWESLAYDLALDSAPVSQICQAYNISTAALDALRQNTYFDKLVRAKKQEVQDMGDTASMTTKFRMISNMAMREFMRRVTSQDTADKEFHAMFRTALELGQYMPKQQSNVAVDMGGGSGNGAVTFNIYNVPGLGHLQNDTVPERKSDIIDVSSVEVFDAIAKDLDKPVVDEL